MRIRNTEINNDPPPHHNYPDLRHKNDPKSAQLQQRVTWGTMYDGELPLLEGESDGGLLGGVQGGVEPAQLPTAVQQPGRQARMRFARLTVCAATEAFCAPLKLIIMPCYGSELVSIRPNPGSQINADSRGSGSGLVVK